MRPPNSSNALGNAAFLSSNEVGKTIFPRYLFHIETKASSGFAFLLQLPVMNLKAKPLVNGLFAASLNNSGKIGCPIGAPYDNDQKFLSCWDSDLSLSLR